MSGAPVPASTRVVILRHRPEGEPSPDDFALEERPLPALADGEVLVRNAFMSVDPSMRGRLGTGEMHYTTNFAVGQPLDGSAVGRVVASRAAGVPVGADAARVVDERLGSLSTWLGSLGQTGFTAYAGLVRTAGMRPGDAVFVSGAAGAVGSAAGQMARLLGASRVVGSAGGAEKCKVLVERLGFDDAFDYRAEPARAALRRVAPEGIDVYFDNVGGEQLAAALHSLKLGGRVALCGQISQFAGPGPAPDLLQAILKRLTLRGFIVRDHEDLREEFETRMSGWLRTGEVTSEETIVDGLEHAVEAFIGMLHGANLGKMLVRLDPGEATP